MSDEQLGFGYVYLNEGGSRLALKTSVGNKWEYYVMLEPDAFKLKRVKKGQAEWTVLRDIPEGSTKAGITRWLGMAAARHTPKNVETQLNKINNYIIEKENNKDEL